jgi:lipoate-protein ligase A
MKSRKIQLIKKSYTSTPTLETAISKTMLDEASSKMIPETLRFFEPKNLVAFSLRDSKKDGFKNAVITTFQNSFDPVLRLSGGKAALFHWGTIGYAWTIPDDNPKANVCERFEEISLRVKDTFSSMGIDAHIGEINGEYCPGKYSVNARRKSKIMGVGQRLAKYASHIGGVINITNSKLTQTILTKIYKDLDYEWIPTTVGSIEDEIGEITNNEIISKLIEKFSEHYSLEETTISKDIIEKAHKIENSYNVKNVIHDRENLQSILKDTLQ